ncbi:MFS transporter [Pyrinomonas methylaliphatogenes]|jgi:NNP family nitrate/nitrite transporter-like MFS transporter|uniref:Nitrate/nitrite transporter n=1 Tax=Pyrinomonas methylaliphatogenes TaxID=454194 RepID=A0A0B6WXQ1_9BACT|nr:MFS transporter [Pyrinomonas methylaliphatogenes]MBX5479557.1 NarK/NasA family nitrate transporter [Pyrinomonas methylaliphatogenes]CDM64950.1 nitrate/nitrite transporter [Pyrinomonas methylaliphatogenes]
MSESAQANRALALATIAFAVSFAVWGLVSALAPTFARLYDLSATQTSLLVASPVLLGSLGRLPAGLFADRYGGRRTFSLLLLLAALPAILIGLATSYTQLVVGTVLLGIAGTTFPVGVGFTSKWFPPERQGFALGVYGMGNIGQSLAVFGVPTLISLLGDWRPVCFAFASLSLIMSVLFYLMARDAVAEPKSGSLFDGLLFLKRSPLAWVLSLFYFLTFGGFVALAIYLPTLLRTEFALSAMDAGARTAGFIILATLMRPLGGWLADRFGGARILAIVFCALILCGLLMSHGQMLTFTAGALGGAAALGAGNGAVFKLVPLCFPKETATVTGLVGAFGGLGGFFPPLVLGAVKDATGSYTLGFILLSLFALACLLINRSAFGARFEESMRQA